MYDFEKEPSKSVRPTAIKWGLRHVGLSLAIVLVSKLIALVMAKLLTGVSTVGFILTNIIGLAFYAGSISLSFYMIYNGMKEYKASSRSPFFPFKLSLKWSVIFALLYLVVYGACSLLLNLLNMSKAGEPLFGLLNTDAIIALPLLWLGPLVLYTILLKVMGFVSGLILKTD